MRDRRDDIATLATAFVSDACRQVGRGAVCIEPDALALLSRTDWPGNVRQLQNTLFRIVSLSEHGSLSAEAVRAECGDSPPRAAPVAARAEAYATYEDALAAFERDLLVRLLPDYPSTRRLALRLGLSHTAVAGKLRRHGLVTRARALQVLPAPDANDPSH